MKAHRIAAVVVAVLMVTSVVAAPLTVAAQVTPDEDPDSPDPDVQSPGEGPTEEPGGFDTLPVVVVAVVLLLGAGYVAYRRRER